MKKISFIIPCYCSALTIRQVVEEVEATYAELSQFETEVILVNDASPDDDATWEVIARLARDKKNVTGINLARNFGQHAALMAGFHATTGDIIVCLDDDGQTPAKESTKLIAAIEKGADAVYARYLNKQHSAARNFGTALNEWMARVLIGKPKALYVSSYFAVRRFVADEMMKYDGSYPYVVGLVLRTTRNIVNVDVQHKSREIGRSGYTFGKLFSLWLNGFTAFSIKPLRVATFTGGVFALLGFLYGIYTIIKKFVNPEVPLGFSAMMCAIVLMGGMIMVMLGLVGEYIGRLYMTGNHSPQYVIRETTKDLKPADE
ncbi:MAG: glycosyltransferase family 2 protein [Lachnospiraceae bacterium]|nr:glycosyltransferase family 2 protein [Lachnospiraceae bacterium]